MNRLNTFPKNDGFRMPGEFEEQYGVIMIWPFREGSWGKDRSGAIDAFCNVVKSISKYEKVFMLAPNKFFEEAERYCSPYAKLYRIEADDSWARDIAPTFVSNGKTVRAVKWKFNAWGGSFNGLYSNWDNDSLVPDKFCEKANIDMYDAGDFVLEGGSIHSDGCGTVMVTERCLLSKGRNPEMSKSQIEEKLKLYLNAEKILWLPRGIYNDETDEHVDNVCAFIRPGEVVLAVCDNKDDPQYKLSLETKAYLQGVTDACGRHLKIHALPVPDIPVIVTEDEFKNYVFEPGEDEREIGERLAASYVNFLFINGAVIMPVFKNGNEYSDRRAVNIMKKLCPEREIIPIYAKAVLAGGGNIHCITQQIPKGDLKI